MCEHVQVVALRRQISRLLAAGAIAVGIELNKKFFKLVSWSDNEWGYSFLPDRFNHKLRFRSVVGILRQKSG